VTEARLREGRTTLQRQHREENVKASTDVLDYLRSLGVDRVACMLTLAKANEALFWESQASGTEEGEEDTLSLAQCEATVGFLRELGCSAEAIPSLVAAHPPLLAYNVESRLRPLADYLLSELNIDGSRFVEALCARPSLLALTASKQRQMIEYLKSTGTEMGELQKYVLESL
jgi:mTERF